jgi:hypothetical protein
MDNQSEAEGQRYTLVFDNNAFCALEAHLKIGIMEIYEEIGSWAPPIGPTGSRFRKRHSRPRNAPVRSGSAFAGRCSGPGCRSTTGA